MPKNILIFSDGTGQRGGQTLSEKQSNIYKLYRACRSGPDSNINPEEQYTYYDAGIGTVPEGSSLLARLWVHVYNLICQATGLGLTSNIVDCYTEILRVYVPGDRIFLFGFSRGAYTVRCLAAVLSMCGIPMLMKDGSAIKKDDKTLRKIADEAVTKVYQHVSSPSDSKYLPQRKAIAARFKEEYRSAHSYPHFIGVFDTVAAVAQLPSLLIALGIALAFMVSISGIIAYFFGGFCFWFVSIFVFVLVISLIAYFNTHFKSAKGLKDFSFLETCHFTDLRMRFYDKQLNTNIGWARHALAIDERRADFDRVPWGIPDHNRVVNAGEPYWFKQIWFAGNHSDIGGSYPETESRLSDIALKWMVGEAQLVPFGIKVDESCLHLYPSAKGIQHDETISLAFKYAKKIDRKVDPKAELHQSVYERFKELSVLQLYDEKPYRPEGLKGHLKCAEWFKA